jgi:probable HAF family extracellular repeat protein
MKGRRRKFVCVAVVSGAAAVLFATVSGAAATTPSQIARADESLSGSKAERGASPLPKIDGVTVSDINDRGQVVGGLTKDYDGATRGFMWKQGSVKLLGRGKFAGASGINERGQILGTSGDEEHAVLWEKGKTRQLGLEFAGMLNERGQVLGGRNLVAVPTGGYSPNTALWTNGNVQLIPFALGTSAAMNNLGQVVGQTTRGRAAEWQDGKLSDLGPGAPVAINDHGEIVGSRGDDLIVWQHGTATDIGPGGMWWGRGPVLNKRGQLIGTHRLGPYEFHAFLWSNGTMTDLGTLGGKWSMPTSISDSGQVVGFSLDRRGVQHGFVWQNGVMTRLPSPAGYRGARTRALAINDHNQIIGDNCFFDCGNRSGPLSGSRFAVLWTLRGHTIETRLLLGIRR